MNNIIIEEARLWLNKERDGLELSSNNEFNSWINKSSLHKEIFEEEKSFRSVISELPEDILSQLSFDNQKEIKKDRFLRKIKKASLVAALFCIVIFASFFTYEQYTPSFQNTYLTSNEVNKNIKLPDTSVIALDKNSKVNITYYKDKREVELLEGKVLFDVYSNKNRPFTIKVNNSLVTVLGTKFEIQKEEDKLNVSVIEGKVSVRQNTNNKSKILAILQKSDSLDVNNYGEVIELKQVNSKMIAVWQKDKLLFEQTNLSNVVNEFSKYLDYKVSIENKELESLPITGEFSINDFENLMKSLSIIHPINIHKIDNTFYIRKKI